MKNKLTKLSIAAILLASTTAQAASAVSDSDMYIKAFGSSSIGHKTEYGKSELKSAPSFMKSFGGGAYLGYHISPNIRAELGLDYNHSMQYQYSTPIKPISGLFKDTEYIRNYDMRIITPMVKGYYDIPINADSTNLYIGAGIGYSFISGSSELHVARAGEKFKHEIEGRNFAFAGMAGISHKISDSITAELGYQFGYHGKPHMKLPRDKTEDLFKVLTHSVNVGVRFAF